MLKKAKEDVAGAASDLGELASEWATTSHRLSNTETFLPAFLFFIECKKFATEFSEIGGKPFLAFARAAHSDIFCNVPYFWKNFLKNIANQNWLSTFYDL